MSWRALLTPTVVGVTGEHTHARDSSACRPGGWTPGKKKIKNVARKWFGPEANRMDQAVQRRRREEEEEEALR